MVMMERVQEAISDFSTPTLILHWQLVSPGQNVIKKTILILKKFK
jgi:hypothetical protein